MITGSAIRKLSAITGLEAKKVALGCYALYIEPSVAYFSFLSDEKDACDALQRDNWNRIINLACERAGWKCERCFRRLPLQGHHVITRARWKRSDGPRDVLSNVAAICAECHEQEHRPAPSSKVTCIIDDLNEIDRLIESAEHEDGLDG